MSVEITAQQEGETAILHIAGTIDEQGAEKLKQQFNNLPLDRLTEVVLDLEGVNQMGSSGIGKILLFYKNLGVKGGHLKVINLAGHLHELFRELKLDTLFTVSGKGG